MQKFELKLRQRDIPENDLLADIRNVGERLHTDSITKTNYDQYGKYGATTLLRRFGSWNKALSAAGMGINNRINIPNEELFENLANVWQTLGRQPVGKDITKSANASKFSLGTYEKRFGSWNKALVVFVQYVENPDNQAETTIDSEGAVPISGRRTPRKINWRLRATVLIRDNCICRMCGASPAKDPSVTLHIDHVVPWSKGGETVIENLQTLCSVCNIGKSDEVFD
ncbi:MAG: HNH endonuclease [Alphaproteobacteria bacterium]|nr:HNH endonuclease [Alphaproteobacteria bacterium]